MMGQPIFVGVDAHNVFKGAGDADFFVRFELGQIDENIGVHRGATQEIFVVCAVVFGVRFGRIVGGAVKPALAGVADKFAR